MSNAQKRDEGIEPIRPASFGASAHKVRQFNAEVSGKLTKKDLENPELWALVARNLTMGNTEIRCIADDMSFVAFGVVTYAQGTTAKVVIYAFHKLDEVNRDEVVDPLDDYVAEMKGAKKWCIVKQSTGEIIKEDMETQLIAIRELVEYKKVLSQ